MQSKINHSALQCPQAWASAAVLSTNSKLPNMPEINAETREINSQARQNFRQKVFLCPHIDGACI
jgi:hypothetical protein